MSILRKFLSVVALTAIGCSGEGSTGSAELAASVEISASPADGVLVVGTTVNLAAVAKDDEGAAMSRPITWSSSNPTIATVSAAGVVTGLSAGAVTILATADTTGDAAELSVRVTIPMTPPGAGAPVTTTVLGGAVALTVPPGAAAATQLTVAPAADVPDDNRVLTNSVFDFGPADASFESPVTVSLRYDPTAVAPAKRPRMRIHRVEDDGSLTMMPGGSVDEVAARVSVPVSNFATYAVVVPADVATITVHDGNSQAAHVGTGIEGMAVVVRDAQARPVPLVEIAFSVVGGGGSIEGSTNVQTDADGIATLPGSWVMGATKGAQSLRASIVGDARFALFAATATAPATHLQVSEAPTTATSGVTTEPFIVQVLDDFGDPVTEIGRVVTATLVSGSGAVLGTTTMDALSGVAIFQNLRVAGVGAHRIRFTSVALTPDTTGSIEVTQQLASLGILTEPAGAVSGQPFATQPVIELRDHAGLRVLDGAAEVTAAGVRGPGVVFGTLTATAVNGVATFAGIAIEGIGEPQLRFSAGIVSVISETFTVSAAPPGVWMRVSDSPVNTVNVGQTFGIDMLFDLSNSSGANLASVGVTITWDTARFVYVDRTPMPWVDANGAPASITIDESGVANGVLVASGSTPGATTSTFALVRVLLQARTVNETTSSVIGASVTSAANAAEAPVPVTVRPNTVTILAPQP